MKRAVRSINSRRLEARVEISPTFGLRHRKDMGDIAGLAAWIARVGGLLHPVVVQPNGVLIAGERRIHAAKLLGWLAGRPSIAYWRCAASRP
jgi:ParB-like nuclease family protein